ncbi:MAG: F0F1 ATP synthase subunit A [Prevotella sp.]|uniref:F0F1 ATP synthase subunit A n=1 Tax=Prevotella sp. AGR2160 TaxID=1280674 RepID=UPI0003F5EC46|nr:F0F1 ATP synthase subunit A [Prevotella sp. AGR2160]MDD5862527.1 F0F1 ATP synthase subunit A [Prevotella sp.]
MKVIKQLFLMLVMFLTLTPVSAKENIDVKGILWGHIKDSYEWHITKVGDHQMVINLPVIVKTTTGWHVFSSAAFSEEKDKNGDRPGPYNLVIKNGDSKTYPNKIVEKVGNKEVRPLDISITKTVCVLFIDAIILLLCILIPARWCRRHKVDDPAPKGFTGLVHMFVMSVYNEVIKAPMGDEAPKYAPWLLTCFFFIFTANIMGIVPFPPGGGNLTGNIACTCFLGVCTFLITNFTGTKAYWKDIFWPEVPLWLKVPVPLMPFIELFGIFTKPLALIIRLFANMMAGHAIALSFAAIIFIMFNISENMLVNYIAGSGMTVVSVAMSVFMMLLEILVSYIQALVFTMLSAVFISLAHVKSAE